MRKQERYSLVAEKLKGLFPDADTELNYNSPFQLLVAVILSAQCTDKRVNIVTPALFERYPDVKSMSESSQEEIYSYIKSISYPNAKSKNLKAMADRLHTVYNDEIPSDTDQLQTLAGVGRKTAMVMAAVLYKKAVMPVDTHVHRVSARIGLTTNAKNVLDTERQLLSNLKKENDLAAIHHQLILLGRYICKARKPLCENCSLTMECKYYNSEIKKKKNK
jgi:endonuclease-3